jgi:predicted small secreted protein
LNIFLIAALLLVAGLAASCGGNTTMRCEVAIIVP